MRALTISSLMVSMCVLGSAAPAAAENEDYYYAGFHLGLSDSLDEDLVGFGGSNLNIVSDKNFGPVGGLYVGRNINKWRYELEYAIRNHSIDTLGIGNPGRLAIPAGSYSGDGNQQSDSLMANAHYNFAEYDGWKAYVGIGIGMSLLQLDNVSANEVLIANSRNWEPSGQAMLHLAKSLGGVELGVGLRHFRTLTGHFGTESRSARYRFANNELFARITWKFGEKSRPAPRAATPAPAPTPALAPAPVVQEVPKPAPAPEPLPVPVPGPFMVFFEFDKSTITADGQSIIERAARDYKKFGIARINASGHADRAGTEVYNQALALRRAEAVRAALINEGVPASRISIRSYGETSPLVPTEDGVREWQNRRVEIVLSR